jgi:hypothetical protein
VPFHATLEEDPQPEVLEAAKPMRHTDDLLDDEIDSLRRALGCAGGVVSEDLGAPASDRASQAVKLRSR